jgi:hypothetical protein
MTVRRFVQGGRTLVAIGSFALVAARPATSAARPAAAAATAAAAAVRVAPHDLHVSNTRIVVEGVNVVARIRMFRDDLEKALKRPINGDDAAKTAVAAYVSRTFMLTANGAALTGELLDSGAEQDGDQAVWWLLVQWKARQPVQSLGLRVHLMFETFSDQQNIVIVARNPGDERRGLYFQAGDRTEQVIRF